MLVFRALRCEYYPIGLVLLQNLIKHPIAVSIADKLPVFAEQRHIGVSADLHIDIGINNIVNHRTRYVKPDMVGRVICTQAKRNRRSRVQFYFVEHISLTFVRHPVKLCLKAFKELIGHNSFCRSHIHISPRSLY